MAYSQQLWDEAKRKCKLGEEEIRMAKEMRLNPKSHKRKKQHLTKPLWRVHLHGGFFCWHLKEGEKIENQKG